MQRPLLRATFEQVPLLYDRARPNYPAQVFDDLVALARLPEAARILEIGCGTGQATLPLAELGFQITCVELGEQLAAIARGKLARFPAVEVINADFETWQPERAEFDGVFAFTAFHWIDPDVRYAKAAMLLRDQGILGVVATEHVLPPDGDDFFLEVQEDYEAVVPDDPATKAGAPKPPDAIPDLSEEISASGYSAPLPCAAISGALPTRPTSTSPSSTHTPAIAPLTTTHANACILGCFGGSRRAPSARFGRRTWRCSTSPNGCRQWLLPLVVLSRADRQDRLPNAHHDRSASASRRCSHRVHRPE